VLLLNRHDGTVRPEPAIELATRWARSGARVGIREMPDSLHLPHDLIDPRERGADTAVVYPVVEALVRGTPAPPWLMTKRAP
jgi:hypothetical protein